MANEEFHGLSVDLTNCLAQRNRELAEAKKAIGALIVTTVLPKADKQRALVQGRDWLKRYNDRMHPPRFAPEAK
jgi:hypothetical protein